MRELAKKFSIKQIAAQAGVSKATVDRVLHERSSVHYQTRRRVEQALQELSAQEASSLAMGRTFHFDVIMHAPTRFTRAVSNAITAQVGSMGPFRISPRFHLFEDISVRELQRMMERCASRGTQGIILKAPDEPLINQAINQLTQSDIPVVTLVTDLPQSQRIGYIGMDNRMAGRTAAYLLSHWLDSTPRQVAVVLSSNLFRGEEEREMGFRLWLRERAPQLQVVAISGGYGVYDSTRALVRETLSQHPSITAVYSVGGGNRGIVDAFADLQRPLDVFIGHDLDEENRQLLAEEKIGAIIDHNLMVDARHAFLYMLQYHRQMLPSAIPPSQVQVITPFNLI